MRFTITMNMPSQKGNLVHQIIAEHPAASLEEFRAHLTSSDFITVEEFYRNDGSNDYTSKGSLVIQTLLCGKVKAFNQRADHR